jgi:hypothetical protein
MQLRPLEGRSASPSHHHHGAHPAEPSEHHHHTPEDSAHVGHGDHNPPPGSHVAVHGMLVFGKHYFSHIPMFHKPHDYQIIMDVGMKHENLPEGKDYGQELHTFVPDQFSLGDLLQGKLKEMEGTLYRGNFEDGGQPIQEHVKVDVKSVLTSQHLEPDSQGPKQLNYLLYGDSQDAYLIHPIAGNAGFDQLVHVDLPQGSVSAEALSAGIPIQLPERSNDVAHRLREADGTVQVQGPEGPIALKVEKELSCLVGPHFMEGPKD